MARSAASIAARVSAAPTFATRATGDPSYGEATSIHSSVEIHSPSSSTLCSVAVDAMERVYGGAGTVTP